MMAEGMVVSCCWVVALMACSQPCPKWCFSCIQTFVNNYSKLSLFFTFQKLWANGSYAALSKIFLPAIKQAEAENGLESTNNRCSSRHKQKRKMVWNPQIIIILPAINTSGKWFEFTIYNTSAACPFF